MNDEKEEREIHPFVQSCRDIVFAICVVLPIMFLIYLIYVII